MACFIVPATEAVVTTVVSKVLEKKEKESEEKALRNGMELSELHREGFSAKLKRLNGLLWGGSALLAFEHVWHGEVVPFFPFLTAAADPADAAEMLHEMSTVGVGMAAVVTVAWGLLTLATSHMEKRSEAGQMARVK